MTTFYTTSTPFSKGRMKLSELVQIVETCPVEDINPDVCEKCPAHQQLADNLYFCEGILILIECLKMGAVTQGLDNSKTV